MPTIALTVCSEAPGAPLSPFFARSGGILLIDPSTDSRAYVQNTVGRSGWLCEEILKVGARGLVCGFIDEFSLHRLASRGVDVRLGPCSVPAESLIERFGYLPEAKGPEPGKDFLPAEARGRRPEP